MKPPIRSNGKNYHPTIFTAQIELANKKRQAEWEIRQTDNGWYVVQKKLSTLNPQLSTLWTN